MFQTVQKWGGLYLGTHVLQTLLHVSQDIFGLAWYSIVLHLSELAVVMLQLPLQLLDGLCRLLVLLLKHLRSRCGVENQNTDKDEGED